MDLFFPIFFQNKFSLPQNGRKNPFCCTLLYYNTIPSVLQHFSTLCLPLQNFSMAIPPQEFVDISIKKLLPQKEEGATPIVYRPLQQAPASIERKSPNTRRRF
jgi:hypothetical protein